MLSLFAFAATIAMALSASDVQDKINEVTTTKEGAKFCPAIIAGNRCPDGSIFHYYECCGNLFADCCFKLQVWVIVVLAVIGVIAIASFVLSLIRCVFCRRN